MPNGGRAPHAPEPPNAVLLPWDRLRYMWRGTIRISLRGLEGALLSSPGVTSDADSDRMHLFVSTLDLWNSVDRKLHVRMGHVGATAVMRDLLLRGSSRVVELPLVSLPGVSL